MTHFDVLRGALSGSLIEPADAGYRDAAQPWNAAVEQHPHAVVDAASAPDVVATVQFARQHRIPVATQPTGHGATGHCDNTILLRTTRLDAVRIDTEARTAHVGAGASWGRVARAAAPYGLTGLAGSSPVVNVAGYLLGGGVSWFSRRHGWASDSVRSVEIVDADGAMRHVRADGDADDRELFWALRGGGGGLGVVLALEIDLYPASPLFGGRMLWPIEHAPGVLDAYRQVTSQAPDELTVWVDMLRIPGIPPMIAADATYLGTPEMARELLKPLDSVSGQTIEDNRGELAPDQVGSITAEPIAPVPFLARSELLTSLPDDVLEALTAIPSDVLLSVRLRHLGGALAGPTSSVPGPMTEPYLLYLLGDPSQAGTVAIEKNQTQIIGAVTNQVSGRRPFTYLSAGQSAADAFSSDTLGTLRKVKRKQDPYHVFRSNFDILA